MPDHLHVVLHAGSADAVRRALGYQLGAFSRELRGGPQWQPVPPPVPVLGDDKIERQLRYTLLNPPRLQLPGPARDSGLAKRPEPRLLRAGLLCLGDTRLCTPPRFRRLRAA